MAVETAPNRSTKPSVSRLFAWRPWLIVGTIEILSFCVRWIGYGRYPGLIYDEYYYVPAADILLGRHSPVHVRHAVPGIDPNLLSHPPLAKELIALCLLWFGNHPWAWRLPGEVLGILVPIGVFLTARALFDSELTGYIAALLSAVDGIMITISRVALPDSTAFPFVILNMLGLWLLMARMRNGRQTKPWVWILWGVSLGLGLAAKWIGAQTILASWLFLLANKKWIGSPKKWLVIALSVTWIPLIAYFLTYFYAFGSGFHQSWLPRNVFLAFGKLQYLMFKSMWSLTFYHPWSSNAWSWMLLPRPTAFLIISHADHLIRVMAFSDPLVIWLGFFSLVIGTWRLGWIKKQNWWAWIYLDIWWLAFYGTWLLTPRSKFTYYLLSAMPAFIIAASALWTHLWTHRRPMARVVAWIGATAVALSSLYLMPLWVGFPTATGFYHHWLWSPSWNAKPRSGSVVEAATIPALVSLPTLSSPFSSHIHVAAVTSWAQFELGPQHNTVLATQGPVATGYARSFAGPIVDPPAVVDNVAYFGTNDNVVVAWSLASAQELWQVTVPNMVMTTPLVDKQEVIVGLGNNIFRDYSAKTGWVRGSGTNGVMAINRITGHELWFFPTTGEDMPTPVLWRGVLYQVTGGGHLDAINPQNGHLLWHIELSGFDSMSSPTVVGDILYVATNVYKDAYPANASTVWAIKLSTRQVLWSRNLPVKSGLSDCSPASNGRLIFIAGAPSLTDNTNGQARISNQIFAINAKSGTVVWQKRLGSGMMTVDVEEEGTPLATGGMVYIGSPAAKKVVALNAANGHIIWSQSVGTGVTANPVLTGSELWVLGDTGDILLLNAKTGIVQRRVNPKMGKFGPGAPIIMGHALIVGSLSGQLGVFRVS